MRDNQGTEGPLLKAKVHQGCRAPNPYIIIYHPCESFQLSFIMKTVISPDKLTPSIFFNVMPLSVSSVLA
jgi:hypothetical protein